MSCEGWSKPGDSYVLQGEWRSPVCTQTLISSALGLGSCGLEYRLVEVPKTLRDDYTGETSSCGSHLNSRFQASLFPERGLNPAAADKFLSTIFSILWISLLVFIAYNFIRHVLLSREWGSSRRPLTGNRGTGPRPWGPGFGGGSGGSGWFNGRDNRRRSPSPPPPYAKEGPSPQSQGGGPGFWTGVAAGGVGSYLFNRATQPRQQSQPQPQPQPATWDWERPGMARSSGWFGQSQPQSTFASRWGSTSASDDNRGEGSSNLGSMRTSTGYGGSQVR